LARDNVFNIPAIFVHDFFTGFCSCRVDGLTTPYTLTGLSAASVPLMGYVFLLPSLGADQQSF
jgi:hypothetical protein